MRQPHRNLFYSYRGAVPDIHARDVVFERQLEDNTTKALINVLEHSNRMNVLRPFLKEVVGCPDVADVELVQFALQRVDINRPQVRTKIALVIAPIPTLDKKARSEKVSGRPDAWMWDEKTFGVLIETKVVGRATLAQVERHIDGAEGWGREAEIKCVAWDIVFGFFNDLHGKPQYLDPTSRLLVGEFLEYLKMISVTNRTVFDIEDFLFFALEPSARMPMHKRAVAQKLERFTEELAQTSGVREIVELYSGKGANPSDYVNPGVFRSESSGFWITIGPKERRNHCHLTVRITDHGIRLDAFSPHRSFTSKVIRRVRRDLDGFLRAIENIPRREPFHFMLREAYYANPDSSYKGQRIGSILDYAEFHPSVITKRNIEHLLIEPVSERLEAENLRPEVFLVRDFGFSEILGKDDAVETVAAAVKRMVPYLKWALSVTK